MEKLHRHSNGSAVTLSDETAVSLKRITGRRESGANYFEFYSSPTAEKTTIEWTGDIAVIPTLTAKVLLNNGYAEHISELQLATWNEMVGAATAQPEQPSVASVPEQTPPVIETPPLPVVEETPPPPVTPPVTPPVDGDSLMPPLPVVPDPKEDALKRAEAEASKAAKAKKASGD